jgi:hypothetical protein
MGDKKGASKKIKSPEIKKQGKNIGLSTSAEVESIENKHPIFCFRYINKTFSIKDCTTDEKVSLVETLEELSHLTWNELQLSPKHGKGSEKIDISSIKTELPFEFKNRGVKHLLAFRFHGKAPFVGYRLQSVFHIFFIDRGYKLYNH